MHLIDCREKSSTSKPAQRLFIRVTLSNLQIMYQKFFFLLLRCRCLPVEQLSIKRRQRLTAIDRVWAGVSWGRKLRNCCRCCFDPRWRLTDRIEAKKNILVHFPPRQRKREWQLGGMTTSCSGAYTINFYGTVLAVLLIYFIKVTVCKRACVLVCLV